MCIIPFVYYHNSLSVLSETKFSVCTVDIETSNININNVGLFFTQRYDTTTLQEDAGKQIIEKV